MPFSAETAYTFIDDRDFYSGSKYCYRIVKVNSEGKKAYAEPQCVEARVIEDFFVSPVYKDTGEGMYKIMLRNKKKQDLTLDYHLNKSNYLNVLQCWAGIEI